MDRPGGYRAKIWASELIDIKEIQTLCTSKAPKPHRLSCDNREACYKLIGCNITPAQFEYLETYCNVEQLKVDDADDKLTHVDVKLLKDKPLTFNPVEVDPNSTLKTHKKLKERKSKKDVQYKYRGYVFMNYNKPVNIDLEPHSEVVIAVRVFRPFSHQRGAKYRQEPSLRQQLLVLGRQYLCELRDAIKCVADGPLMKETSEDPEKRSTEFAKDKYKSGFFFIEGTFYNDFRFPTNIDYSEVIRKWASERDMTFEAKTMEQTKFTDLTVRLGHPYIYQHQGNCEHLIVFSDIRLLSANDALLYEAYPVLDVIKKIKTRMCIVCGLYAANWVTKNNERVFSHTAYFCNTCFISFNYIDGKKIGNFMAYPIYQE